MTASKKYFYYACAVPELHFSTLILMGTSQDISPNPKIMLPPDGIQGIFMLVIKIPMMEETLGISFPTPRCTRIRPPSVEAPKLGLKRVQGTTPYNNQQSSSTWIKTTLSGSRARVRGNTQQRGLEAPVIRVLG